MNPSNVLRRSAALVAIVFCTTAQGTRPGAQGQGAVADPARWPVASSPAALTDARTEAMADALLKQLTVEEKVGQVVQADISSVKPDDLKTYPLGSVQAGGNSSPGNNERSPASAWVALLREFRAANKAYWGNRAAIPIMFGVDAVHGHSNIVGATIFPHYNEGDAVCPSR